MSASDRPSTIYGVDFSAAAGDAGRNTWIAECRIQDEALVVDDLADASAMLSCAPDRDSTISALVDLIEGASTGRRAFGLDFPFGLPGALLDGRDWRTFVSDALERDRWGVLENVDGPKTLYENAKSRVDRRDDLLRRTDERCGGQAPTGYRIKTQTYYGISDLLGGLPDDVAVVPMDDVTGFTIVLETYPAATFRRLQDEGYDPVHDTGYKHDTRESIDRRRENVDALSEAGVEYVGHDDVAVAADHALDSVAAAWATWRAAESGYEVQDGQGPADVVTSASRCEGYIYR